MGKIQAGIFGITLFVGSFHIQAQEIVAPKRLTQIVDVDAKGKQVTKRSEFKFDKDQRRIANKVLDAKNKPLATEKFKYAKSGAIAGREYFDATRKLKWKWNNFKSKGELTTRNDIVNGRGKKIGWYVWRYDKLGKLSRRDRYEANGKLRFYYANIKRDQAGNDLEWTKYDARGKKLGTKKWIYEKQK